MLLQKYGFDEYTHFTKILTSFNALGQDLINLKEDSKIIYYLLELWDTKVMAITKLKVLNFYFLTICLNP